MIPAAKKRVLFVCIGNACRSQMAEGFARAYGTDVLIPASAGVSLRRRTWHRTPSAPWKRRISIFATISRRALRHLGRADFDIVVNMSGFFLPETVGGRIVDWEVADPVFMEYAEHCEIRDEIEQRVMKLVLELRRAPRTQFRGQGSGRLEP